MSVKKHFIITLASFFCLAFYSCKITIIDEDTNSKNIELQFSSPGYQNSDSITVQMITLSGELEREIYTGPRPTNNRLSFEGKLSGEYKVVVRAVTKSLMTFHNIFHFKGTTKIGKSQDVLNENLSNQLNIQFTPTTIGSNTSITLNIQNNLPSGSIIFWTKDGVTTYSKSKTLTFTSGLPKAKHTVMAKVVSYFGYDTTKTLHFIVKENNNAELSSLNLSVGTLTPDFNSQIKNYRLFVDSTVNTISVIPTLLMGTSSVTVNGVPVNSGSPSIPIPLALGSNIIVVHVTAEDGETSNLYTIEISRLFIKTITTGFGHTLLIKSDGTLWGTGNNSSGELGNGTNSNINIPIQIMPGSTFTKVFAGLSHSLMIKNDGTLWGTGNNSSGELGNGTNSKIYIPIQIMPGATFTSVAAGSVHTLMIKSDRTLWGTGSNNYGQLGDGTNTNKYIPIQILPGSTFTKVTASLHTLMIKSDGSLWGMGYNDQGQLGDGTTISKNIPVQIMPGSTFIAVAAGFNHSVMIKSDGTLWAMGNNEQGQLGDGTTISKKVPVQIMPGSTFSNVDAGYSHTLMIKSDGTLWGTGYNGRGQLGIGTTTNTSSPIQIMPGSTFTAVAAETDHSLMIKGDGTLWGTGYNEYGQLGDGTNTNKITPVKIF